MRNKINSMYFIKTNIFVILRTHVLLKLVEISKIRIYLKANFT